MGYWNPFGLKVYEFEKKIPIPKNPHKQRQQQQQGQQQIVPSRQQGKCRRQQQNAKRKYRQETLMTTAKHKHKRKQKQTQTQTQTTTDWSSRLFGLLTLLLLLRLLLSVCRRGILFKVTHRISVFCFMRLLLHTHILTNNTSAKWKSEKENRLRQTTPIPFRHYQRAFSIPCS